MAAIRHFTEIEAVPVETDGARGAKKRLLIGTPDGVPRFSVRMFDIEKGGNTPHHAHDFEHEIFILEGTGKVLTREGEKDVTAGIAVFIPPGEDHKVVNTGDGLLRVLCMVPKEYE